MASSNGGRRRGRPRIYTPERKLELERERDRFKKAAKRKREADAKWQRGTNFGYFERLWVPHPNELSKVLVAAGFVHENDIDLAPFRLSTAGSCALGDREGWSERRGQSEYE